jgi:hypothetical protein
MYKIIGGDGNEYGPISADVIRQWYAEGRVNGETQVKMEGGSWLPMSAFPEFAALATQKIEPPPAAPATPPPFPTAAAAAAGPTLVPEDDYELDIGGCIRRGWELVKGDFGVLVGGFLLYFLIIFGLASLSNIPSIGRIFSLIGFIITGPLLGGLFFLYLKAIRGGSAGVGEMFAGFQRAFLQLFMGHLVRAVASFLCMLPALITSSVVIWPTLSRSELLQALVNHQQLNPQELSSEATQLMQLLGQVTAMQWMVAGGVWLLCTIPQCYLQISWVFTLPLIIDKEMDFWTAMKTSWRRVNHHWWHVFGVVVVGVLVSTLGLIFCCVGALITVPIAIAALMFAYETTCSGRKD